jgi:hypothetical protein
MWVNPPSQRTPKGSCAWDFEPDGSVKISGSGKIVATITGLTTGIEEKAGKRDDLLNPQRFRPTLPRTWQLNLAPPRISFFFSPFLALEQRDAVSL